MTNQLIQKNNKTKFSVFLTQESVKSLVRNSVKDSKGFISSISSAVSRNPALAQCDQASILSAGLLGASLGLQPSEFLGQFYMVPFKDNKRGTTVAQFVLGYKGLLQLAIRSGYYKRINCIAIKEGEYISYNPLTEEFQAKIITDDNIREKAKSVGYYAMFEYNNGFVKTLYWSKEKMEAHALQYSKGYAAKKGYTFWEKDFDAMALKTMLRQILSKWGILSVELQQALEKDDKMIDVDGEAIDIQSDNDKEIEIDNKNNDVKDVKKEKKFDVDDGNDSIEPLEEDPLK